jgi:hypothetical protein
MGRPSSLTPELQFEICDRIADGETVRQIALSDHMPAASTIYLTLSHDKVFSEQYARAREAQLERWEDEILEIADDGSNDWTTRNKGEDNEHEAVDHEHIARSKVRIDARKWLMAKRAPKRYGDKLDHTLAGPDGGAVQIERIERVVVDPLNNN